MTVDELIAELQGLDPTAPVAVIVAYAREGEEGLHPITVLEITGIEGYGAVRDDAAAVILATGRECER